MELAQTRRAVAAAASVATALDLPVDDVVVLNNSNRLVVRLTPSDTVARVTPSAHHAGHQMSPEREVEVVIRLADTDSPVALLEPRVEPQTWRRDGFTISLWAYYEPGRPAPIAPDDYAYALGRLHAGLRQIELPAPRALDRVAAVLLDVADRAATPDLADTDRTFLAETLRELTRSVVDRRRPEQLLHGEPHPGNVLRARGGLLFTDFENTAHGPLEYDLGWVPRAVTDRCRDADQDLIDTCRGLVLAMVTAYRWRRDDQHPSGRGSGLAFLDALRNGPPWPALDDVTW